MSDFTLKNILLFFAVTVCVWAMMHAGLWLMGFGTRETPQTETPHFVMQGPCKISFQDCNVPNGSFVATPEFGKAVDDLLTE